MIIIAIIVLLIIFKAYREGRFKLVLTDQEAAAVRAQWWAAAKAELKMWAFCALLGSGILVGPVSENRMPIELAMAIGMVTLLIFSRLAIWLGLIIWVGFFLTCGLAQVVGYHLIRPEYLAWSILAILFAIGMRFVFSLMHPELRPLPLPKAVRSKEEYEMYRQTPEWKAKATVAKQRAGWRCQVCNASSNVTILDTHHRTYDRIGHELPEDLTVLCRDCHHLFEEQKQGRRLAR